MSRLISQRLPCWRQACAFPPSLLAEYLRALALRVLLAAAPLGEAAGGANGLEALRQWADKDRVGLKARLGELKVTEEQAESVFGAIASVGAVDVS